MSENPAPIIQLIVDIFERLGVPYLIGGSIASMIHGVIRTTMDADIVADLRADQVEAFVNALAGAFYLDTESIRDAIRHRRCFNVIHLATMFKIDIFIPRWDRYLREEFNRRKRMVVTTAPERSGCVASVEDTILAKLSWYRQGGHVSDRQWRDVLELIKIHRDRLELTYLHQWATELEVQDLLEKAMHDAA